jgi:hypothetical protein
MAVPDRSEELKRWIIDAVTVVLLFTIATAGICYLFSSSCKAAELDGLLLGKSWHFDGGGQTYSPNQWNWGAGLDVLGGPWNHWKLGVGGLSYRDSFRQQAYAVYGEAQYSQSFGTINTFAAVRAGYLNGSGHHGLGILPSIGIGYQRLSIEATFIPKSRNGWNCVAVWLRYTIKEW